MSNKILIAGQEGMVGGAVYRFFKTKKLNIINCKRKELDFTSQNLINGLKNINQTSWLMLLALLVVLWITTNFNQTIFI